MNEIICGDALDTLKTLDSGIVQTCVTSPPYFGLRNYNVEGQIGLEDTPEAYIARLVEVFREVRRVLRDDGTCWINIGDSYAGSGKGGQSEEKRSENWQPTYANKGLTPRGYKPKDLIGIPWMLAFALRADGWYLRQDCIWSKSNPMPESVLDRPTTSHEHIFLLAKNEHYYYDAQAIAEPTSRPGEIGSFGGEKGRNWMILPDDPNYRNGYQQWGRSIETGTTRNKWSVWSVSTRSYPHAHFATFPPKLIEPCILAGTSPQACEVCGAPWERVTERIQFGKAESKTAYTNDAYKPARLSGSRQAYRAMGLEGPPSPITIGWQPICTHDNTGSGKCIVLDPFCGAGTVPMVAMKYSRDYLGIELNPDYCKLIEQRIATVQPDLWEATA